MSPFPIRPEPREKVTNYDDGDPYACMAKGRAEYDLQLRFQQQVAACFLEPTSALEALIEKDAASVRTALYDLWTENRYGRLGQSLAAWAAQHMNRLGNSQLVEYDRMHPGV